MLTDDDCRAIRKALDAEALLNTDVFDDGDIRRMFAAINAMPDGPVWVVPREASETAMDAGFCGVEHFIGDNQYEELMHGTDDFEPGMKSAYRAMVMAGAAEVGED